jgi:hypothetical protein
MSERLDTVTLLREMRDRQRERGRFDYQRVAVDSVMAAGLVAVGWLAVKTGLGLYNLSRIAQDPEGAARDAARGLEMSALRGQIRMLQRPVLKGARLQSQAGREAALTKAVSRLSELEAVQAEVDEEAAADTPGVSMLRDLDRFLARYGPVAPVTIMGGNILMETLRVRRMREL